MAKPHQATSVDSESIDELAELALVDDVCTLPAEMQKIYLQLVSAVDVSLQRLRSSGAVPAHISEDFIEETVNLLLQQALSQQSLQDRMDQEFQRRILAELDVGELAHSC